MSFNLLDISVYLLLLLPIIILLLILLVEGLILYVFKIGKLIRCVGIAFIANGISFLLCFFSSGLLKLFGYEVSLTYIPMPVLLFFCWFSIIIEALVFKLFRKNLDTAQVFKASMVLNVVTFFLIYVFLLFSH
ncbi:MAG: hypothetical protein ACM3VS_09495 [Candidatus Dadabacteria bacterium]